MDNSFTSLDKSLIIVTIITIIIIMVTIGVVVIIIIIITLLVLDKNAIEVNWNQYEKSWKYIKCRK